MRSHFFSWHARRSEQTKSFSRRACAPEVCQAIAKSVARLERSESRDSFHAAMPIPAFAPLKPGYEATKEKREAERRQAHLSQ